MRRKTIAIVIAGIAVGVGSIAFLHRHSHAARRAEPVAGSPRPAAPSSRPPLASTWPTAHIPVPAAAPAAAESEASGALRPATALITGLTPDLDYQHRLAAIHALDNRLPAADVARLMAYLADPATARPGNLFDLALKNDTLAALLRQERLPGGLGEMLAAIVGNPAQDLTWRDYSLQAVPAYVERAPARSGAGVEALRGAIEAALAERGTVLPGTALIAMGRLSGPAGLYDTNAVSAVARRVLDHSEPGDPARITAIQMLARGEAADSLSLVRRMARDESLPILERMSAMAALGRIGGAEDRQWLKEIEKGAGQDSRLRAVARYNRDLFSCEVKP